MLGVDDGTRPAANWQGRVPFDDLPQVHDPASGWLQSCNTAANYVTEGQTMRAEDFPPGVVCGHYFADGRTWRGRGRRCFEVMPTMHNVTLEQAARSHWTRLPRRTDLGPPCARPTTRRAVGARSGPEHEADGRRST